MAHLKRFTPYTVILSEDRRDEGRTFKNLNMNYLVMRLMYELSFISLKPFKYAILIYIYYYYMYSIDKINYFGH